MKNLTKILILILAAACLAACSTPSAVSQTDDGPGARLIVLNIGKADCMLLLYEDQAFLIDAGYPQNYAALKTMLDQYGVTRLNGVILTHCHIDHYGGLDALARSSYTIDAWYAPEIYYDVKEGAHPAVLAAAAKGSPVTWLKAGDVIPVGSQGEIAVLGPTTVNDDNENNNSLVARFSCPDGSILFAGDMKKDEEYDLIKAKAFTKCDVLKVGHHGDSGASTLDMLRLVQPKVSLILTSTEEELDTPARATLTRLSASGSQVYVSQDAHDAWMIELKNGTPTVTDVIWTGVPLRAENVKLQIDLKNDLLTIQNNGAEPLDLSGALVYSSKGGDVLSLPDATVAPGGRYTVGSRSTKIDCDYAWSVKRVWHQKRYDKALLCDAYGRLLACTDNDMPE